MDDIEHVRAERDAAYELVDTLRTERDDARAELSSQLTYGKRLEHDKELHLAEIAELRGIHTRLCNELAEARAEIDRAAKQYTAMLYESEVLNTQFANSMNHARQLTAQLTQLRAESSDRELECRKFIIESVTARKQLAVCRADLKSETELRQDHERQLDDTMKQLAQLRAAAERARNYIDRATCVDGQLIAMALDELDAALSAVGTVATKPCLASNAPFLPTDAEYEAPFTMDECINDFGRAKFDATQPRPASTDRTGLLGIHDLSLHHFVKVSTRVGYHFAVVADLAHEGALEDMAKRPGVFDADAVRGLLNLYAECAEYYARSDWFDADAMDAAVLRVRDSEKPEALAHDQAAVHELIRCVMNLDCVDGETVAAAERVRDSGYAYYASSRTERDKHVAELVEAASTCELAADTGPCSERLRAALAKFEVQP